VDAYSAGASQEQLRAARARVTQAQAALDGLLAQRAEMTLLAPADGVLLSRAVHVGEIASPGAALMTLADLSEVNVTAYVAENQLGRLVLDGPASVVVDSFPGRTFSGRVARVADQAQFTPRNVATKEERVNTVYAVEIQVPNPDGLLKPGMAADVTFLE
jgi:HlyD family secretion protein